jgi:phosphopantothenoylcysteine decarboxylase/phosphopantothenate--cysteine ligase
MWENPATQANLKKLEERGVHVVHPGSGYLACGMIGEGRLADNKAIVAAALEAIGATQDLMGETVLITAGPTREKIDPVRYLGNRSSGRMGYALAEAALRRGARVVLVSGPAAIQPPSAAELVKVETSEEMRQAVLERVEEASIIIKAAAVSDFRVAKPAEQKMKRSGRITLELEPTTDILAELASRKKENQIIAGFAAESHNALENARKKLRAKRVDAIVVNDISQPGIGFDSEHNAVTILTEGDVIEVPETSKWEVAQRVLDAVVGLRKARGAADATVATKSGARR